MNYTTTRSNSNDDNDLFQFFDFNSKDLNWLLPNEEQNRDMSFPLNTADISNNNDRGGGCGGGGGSGSKRTRQGSIESSIKAAKLESFGRIIARSALPTNSLSRSGHSFDNLVALVVRILLFTILFFPYNYFLQPTYNYC